MRNNQMVVEQVPGRELLEIRTPFSGTVNWELPEIPEARSRSVSGKSRSEPPWEEMVYGLLGLSAAAGIAGAFVWAVL